MSIILITNHDENIYNVTKEAARVKYHSPRYVSKYNTKKKVSDVQTTKLTYDTCQCERRFPSMGRPYQMKPDPCDFLKKKAGLNKKIKSVEKEPRTRKDVFRHPNLEEVKKFNEEREARAQNSKNFISLNIKQVLDMKPKEPEQKIVINRFGKSTYLKRGLEPIYIKSEVFGRTPDYLEAIIRENHQKYQEVRDNVGLEQPKCRYITMEEREKLLGGLKQNWEELQKQYQGLPILTDTIPKKNRKSKMEADLKQLEKDIVLIERHPYIYVYNDDDFE